MQLTINKSQGENSELKKAIGSDWKGKGSPIIYVVALALAYSFPWLSMALYAVVALIWIMPDPSIEKMYRIQERH